MNKPVISPTKQKVPFGQIVLRSQAIRKRYHELERKHHGSRWTTEEDVLAFLTDAALVGRLTMAKQGRWPKDGDNVQELQHKLGECIWWLIVLAGRMGIDAELALETFFSATEKLVKVAKPRKK